MKKIRETILYWIVNFYFNHIYLSYMYKVDLLKERISECESEEEAEAISSRKIYENIPTKYKNKLIYEKFSRGVARKSDK